MPSLSTNANPQTARREDGDTGFVGVDERGKPAQLEPGRVAAGRNVRFRDGILQTRDGCMILPWMKDSGFVPFDNPTHAKLFSQPSGQEWLLVVADGIPYRSNVDGVALELPMELGVDLAAPVRLHQAFDKIIAGRGADRTPLVMNHLDTGFVAVTDASSESGNGTGTLPLPNFQFGESAFNRFLVVAERDQVFISDILNYTRHSLSNAQRINEGSAAELLRVVGFNRDTAICFKDDAVYKLTNWSVNALGNLDSLASDPITKAHGLAAPEGVCEYLGDLYYVTDQGVTNLRLTEQNEIQAVDLPLSDPLRRSWARINWSYRDAIRLETWDNKLYVAAPLDDATVVDDTDLVPDGATYNSTTKEYTLTGLTPGVTYKLSVPTTSTRFESLTNGTQTLTGDDYFTAQGSSVILTEHTTSLGGAVDVSINEVLHLGVNTGVFVFDFLNRQWAGVDEADGILHVVDFLKPKIDGQRRLVFLSANGCFYLYEEGWEDEILEEVTPYVDLILEDSPAVGDTIQVNGGTLITTAVQPFNGASTWGILEGLTFLGTNAAALWQGAAVVGVTRGFNPACTNPWTAPNTTPTQIADGVRFTSTNGAVPVLNISGSWALTDTHFGMEPVPVDIVSSADTRAYRHGSLDRKRTDTVTGLFSVWNARLTVTALANGINEEQVVLNAKTYDRTANYLADRAAYDPTNPDDDHGQRGREDYSVPLPDLGLNLGAGVAFDLMQEVTEDLRCHSRGESTQFRIECDRGRFALHSLLTTARVADRASTAKA